MHSVQEGDGGCCTLLVVSWPGTQHRRDTLLQPKACKGLVPVLNKSWTHARQEPLMRPGSTAAAGAAGAAAIRTAAAAAGVHLPVLQVSAALLLLLLTPAGPIAAGAATAAARALLCCVCCTAAGVLQRQLLTLLGSMVQKGKFSAGALSLVSRLNSVLLPTLGRPTMPIYSSRGIAWCMIQWRVRVSSQCCGRAHNQP